MIFCKIENGVVVNRALVNDAAQWPRDDTWVQDDTAQIGWSYDGKVFAEPPPAPEPDPIPVPPSALEIRLAKLESALTTKGVLTPADIAAAQPAIVVTP